MWPRRGCVSLPFLSFPVSMKHALSLASPTLSRVLAMGGGQERGKATQGERTKDGVSSIISELSITPGSLASRSPDLFDRRQDNKRSEDKGRDRKRVGSGDAKLVESVKKKRKDDVQNPYCREQDGESSSIPSSPSLTQPSYLASTRPAEIGRRTIYNGGVLGYSSSQTERERQIEEAIHSHKAIPFDPYKIRLPEENKRDVWRESRMCPVSRVDLPLNILQLMENYGAST